MKHAKREKSLFGYINDAVEAESIEDKMRRVMLNGEPIGDATPEIYTEQKDGVQGEYDIRTDRFDIAVEAHDRIEASRVAKRDKAIADAEKAQQEVKMKEVETPVA